MTDHPRKPGYLWVPAWKEFEAAVKAACEAAKGDEDQLAFFSGVPQRVVDDFWDAHTGNGRSLLEGTYTFYRRFNIRHACGIARLAAGGSRAIDKALAAHLRDAAAQVRGE